MSERTTRDANRFVERRQTYAAFKKGMLYDGDTVSAAGAPDSPTSRIIIDLEADDADEAAGATSYRQRVHLCKRVGTARF